MNSFTNQGGIIIFWKQSILGFEVQALHNAGNCASWWIKQLYWMDNSPCCLIFDGTGMLLNSLTSLTLPTDKVPVRLQQWLVSAVWQHKNQIEGLTSCPSWAWRCTASALRCTRGWTSSGGTWGDTQSGPAGSERQKSRSTAVRQEPRRLPVRHALQCDSS